jgi:pilus assembly protein CpaF
MSTGIYCAKPELEDACRRLVPELVNLLNDGSLGLQELSVNYDPVTVRCRVFVDDGKGPMRDIRITLPPGAIIALARILATIAGKSLDRDAPFLSCSLASGLRFHAALPPVADGPSCSIRTHARILRPMSDFGTPEQVEFMSRAVLERRTILIAGGTFSGKTTLLNSLLNLIPANERLLVAEDEHELIIRPGNVTRRRATAKADLRRHVIEALRDRPDWLIVGEVRGAEARDMLEAASVGHPSMSTVHANGSDAALARLARLADCDPQFVSEALDLVLYLKRMPDGQRRVAEIKEL